MPNLVPLQSVVVQRGGETVVPPIGSVFEFTDKEASDIMASNPNALSGTITIAADDAPPSGKGGKGGKKAQSEDL